MMEFQTDRFHAGVRAVSIGLWLAAIGVLYLGGRWLGTLIFGSVAGFGVLALAALAFLAAQPVAYLAEQQLIRFWPSGRALALEGVLVTLREKSNGPRVRLDQPVTFRRWRFQVRTGRGGHVPRGHHCLAVRLAQSDQAMSLYTFMSPAQMKTLTDRFPFYELRRARDSDLPATTHAGRDPAYLDAEADRWNFGAELDAADFEKLLDYLNGRVAGFGEKPAAQGNL